MSENNSQTQNQISALRTLQQSYDALADASVSGATATALENAKQAILIAIDTIDDQIGDVESVLEYIEQGGMPEISAIAKQGTNANANISEIQSKIGAPASGQPTDLFAAIAAGGGGGSSSTPQITVDDSVTSIELHPNTLYIFTNRTANLTITLAAGQQDVVNEYHMFIEIGATIPTITWPNNLNWVMSWDPGVNSVAEISILNNSVIWV